MNIKFCDLCGKKITTTDLGTIKIDYIPDILPFWDKEIIECCNECTKKNIKSAKRKKERNRESIMTLYYFTIL